MKELEKITSRDNSRLVSARRVRDGKEVPKLFVEGRRLIVEALRSELYIEECFVAEGFADLELLDAVATRAVKIAEVTERVFQSITDTNHSQGIVLIADRPRASPSEIEQRLGVAGLPIVLFLNQINNPANLGAIIRTAEAADIPGVIVSTNSADVFSPKALRAAMGSSFRMPIWQNAAFEDVVQWAESIKLTTTAADVSASKPYVHVDWKVPRLLVFGSEAHGLDISELEMISESVRIPMENGVESLNLAVSAGIILFEAKRQNS